jgi:hypothetical protein
MDDEPGVALAGDAGGLGAIGGEEADAGDVDGAKVVENKQRGSENSIMGCAVHIRSTKGCLPAKITVA